MAHNFTSWFIKILLAITLLANSSGCGDIEPVKVLKECIVNITSEVGKVVSEKASTLAAALKTAWEKVFPNFDPNDPSMRITSPDGLKGECTIKMRIKITEPGKIEMTIDLNPPFAVYRKTVKDPWEVSPECYPPDFRRSVSGS
jgi:hypothetical protein